MEAASEKLKVLKPDKVMRALSLFIEKHENEALSEYVGIGKAQHAQVLFLHDAPLTLCCSARSYVDFAVEKSKKKTLGGESKVGSVLEALFAPHFGSRP